MEIAKFQGGGLNPKISEPFDKKFGVGDYVVDDSPHAKTQDERPIEGMATYASIITLTWFLVFLSYPFLWPQILLTSQDYKP